jgi:hypothetical protein
MNMDKYKRCFYLRSSVAEIKHQTAAAPPTISEISWVIAAWRALL